MICVLKNFQADYLWIIWQTDLPEITQIICVKKSVTEQSVPSLEVPLTKSECSAKRKSFRNTRNGYCQYFISADIDTNTSQ